MDALAGFFADNPFVLLFAVIGLGYLAGRVRVGGFSLGVSAVLFVGLAFGALGPEVALPEFVYLFGLVLFVYTVGVAAGPGFVAALRKKGLAQNGVVLLVLLIATAVALVAAAITGMSAPVAAGMFSGSLTNTPALATVIEAAGPATSPLLDPVVGYSMAYPFGVLGMILGVHLGRRSRRHDRQPGDEASEEIGNLTVLLDDRGVGRLADVVGALDWRLVISRHSRAGQATVPTADTRLEAGDLITLVGPEAALPAAAALLGEPAGEDLSFDRNDLDARRIFVSDESVVGQRLSDLRLPERFGAVVTRIKRGDVDALARPGTVLEPGDRVRVVAPRERMDEISQFFGDSYRKLSEIDAASFSLGLTVGLLVGLVPVPLPGGTVFRLGLAGGPLVVGLVLGALERTGPIAWQLPYNANLTLRQLGAILFLAGVGTRSGYAFAETISTGEGLPLVLAGALVTSTAAAGMLVAGRLALKVPAGVLAGMMAGVQTQPAVLAFAVEQEGDEEPNVGYATVFPVAMIAKILLAQVVLYLA